MTLFRFHRGSLADSMETVREVKNIFELGMAIIREHPPGNVRIEPYGYDDRIGWDTHIVTVDGNAIGFTDGPLP